MTTETTTKKKSITIWYIVVAIVIIVVIVVGIVLYEQSLTPPSGGTTPVALTLYEGEIAGTATYGFGNTASDLTTPGPQLTLTQGTTYTMTVYNVGTLQHSWEISSSNTGNPSPLFNSEINPGTYINPGASGSVTFTPNQSGNFYYVCPVPGHTDLGMWGNVVISAAP
jgi:uncharacterized cupredoxin-like copper-binding protein